MNIYTSKYANGEAVDAALDKSATSIQGSTGAVDNAVLRADGTGTKTVQAGGLVLVLGDDGSMQFTGTATAPNAPGSGAIDLVNYRIAANQVANGAYAAAFGYGNTASGEHSFAFGRYSYASGLAAVAVGQECLSSGNNAASFGMRALSANVAQFAQGYSAPGLGQCQANIQTLYGTTSTADAKILTIDDSTARMVLPAKRAIAFTGLVTAMSDATDGYKVAAWEIKGILTRDASNNTRIVGTPTTTSLGADAEADGWAVSSITADDTNEALSITVTGEAATNIRWNVSLFYGQIGYA